MGAGGLARQSAACLGWKLADLSTGRGHQEARTAGEGPQKAPVVWRRKEERYFKRRHIVLSVVVVVHVKNLERLKGQSLHQQKRERVFQTGGEYVFFEQLFMWTFSRSHPKQNHEPENKHNMPQQFSIALLIHALFYLVNLGPCNWYIMPLETNTTSPK